jgi:hypothetical protein
MAVWQVKSRDMALNMTLSEIEKMKLKIRVSLVQILVPAPDV